METTRLLYFTRVFRLGSVTAAARTLNVTPAAVSKSIRALEAELGFALVVRHGRGLLVTDRGRLVAEHAEQLLADVEALFHPDRLSSKVDRSLRLGTCAWFASVFYGELVAQHRPAAPISLFDAAPAQLEHALVSGIVDVTVSTAPTTLPDVECLPVGRMPMGVFARADLVGRHAPRELPFAVHGATSVAGDEVHGGDGWPFPSEDRVVRFRVGSTASVHELCRRGLAAAYLPVFVAALHNRDARASMRLVRVEFPVRRGVRQDRVVHVACRTSDTDRAGLAHLVGPLRSICCDLAI